MGISPTKYRLGQLKYATFRETSMYWILKFRNWDYPLVNVYTLQTGKSSCSMGKSTISMAIFYGKSQF